MEDAMSQPYWGAPPAPAAGEEEQPLELLDVPGPVWTGGFVGLAVFVVASFWQVGMWHPLLSALRRM